MFTGVFLGWQNDVISFMIFDAGIVQVNYKKVNTLHCDSNKYRIETTTKKLFYEELTCLSPGEFQWMEDGNPISIPFKEIYKITPYKKSGTISGYVGFGYTYAKSNGFGLLSLDKGMTINTKSWSIEGVATNNLVHTADNSWDRNREFASIKTNRIVNPRWQLGTRYIYQRNKELGLAYRYLMAGGFESNIIKKSNFVLNLSSGLAFALEGTFDDQSYSRSEIPFLFEMVINNLGGSNISLNHTQILFMGLGNNGRIRHDGELRINLQLNKKLALTTYIFNNYDSAPIQKLGVGNLDYGWNTGLKIFL